MLSAFSQSLAYVIAALTPYLMITSPPGSLNYLLFFPFFAMPILILLYYSDPLSAAGMTVGATLVGTSGLIFTLTDWSQGAPLIFFVQILGMWGLFWYTQNLIETKEVKIHRLQEEAENLELSLSDSSQLKKELEHNCVGIQQKIGRFAQLQSFTDLASSLQVKQIQEQAEKALEKFFTVEGTTRARVDFFPAPNRPALADAVTDWVVRYRIPLSVEDYSQDSRLAVSKKGSLIACPIERDGLIVGMVSVESSFSGAWKEEDLRLLSAVSNIVSLLLTNAIYYEKVESLAVKDSLTGLFVRYRFDERIEEEYSRSQAGSLSLSLVMFDLDHFKKVNDRWGHSVGDVVLKTVAKTILDQTRETDFCARYGGEEIAVLMPFTSEKNAFQIAERIRKNIEENLIGEQGVKITVSGGLATLAASMTRAEELIAAADQALYRAKQAGRNRVLLGNVHA